jgi:quercetin dioxygenase-like cupin family protein
MSSRSDPSSCEHLDAVSLLLVQALPSADAARLEEHMAGCAACRDELEALRPVVDAFMSWPVDVLRPPQPLWGRLADRIANETGRPAVAPPETGWVEPAWEEVAPGIECKLLATEPDRVSMLVRLAPGVEYPPHRHDGIEELHLLSGELWIDDRKLHPGDYNRAEPGTADQRVWSETGCTCVLITSPKDVLG